MGACQSSSAVAKSVVNPKANEKANGIKSNDDPTTATTVTPNETSESMPKTPGTNPKLMKHSSSAIGLDSMIESRREEGDLITNVVRIETSFGQPIEEVYEGVHDGPILGKGVAGVVRLVTHRTTRLKYAVKCLDLRLVGTANELQQLREEVFIMCQLDHPNIVRLEEVYESNSEIYLVQELCLGGDLFDRLDEQTDYHYTEGECARLVKQICSAVRYLHSKGIIHRDLKLENFLFSTTEKDSELKMCDFGLSKHFSDGEKQTEVVGTPYTVAPEVIEGNYDERCDLWAVGVITFLLLSGEPPFGGCGDATPYPLLRQNILRGWYRFEPSEVWDLVSSEARSFIRTLLVVNPHRRPTAQEAQNHPWMKLWADKSKTENDASAVLNPNVVKALVNFKGLSDIRRLLSEVLSFTLLPDQIKGLRAEFEKMDKDGSGEISLEALESVLIQSADAGSLGALTKEEIHDIFDAMRVSQGNSRLHWHEFLAATLSQCQVDDRNLRLAFDRLDSDHKGYIALEDIMDLLGTDAQEYEQTVRDLLNDGSHVTQCKHSRITYDDFVLIMKGQTNENVEPLAVLGRTRGNSISENTTDTHSQEINHCDAGIEDLLADVSACNYRRLKSLSETKNTGEFFAPDCYTIAKHELRGSLYEAHMQLRLAILEASKRFEENQHKRASVAIEQMRKANGGTGKKAPANLVMRNERAKQVSSEAIFKHLNESETQRQELVEVAFKRGGRGRRARMKTVSDLYGMVSSTRDALPSSGEDKVAMDLNERRGSTLTTRKPTKPGEFHTTLDPLQETDSP